MWLPAQQGSSLIYAERRPSGGTYTFSTSRPAVVFADARAYYSSSSSSTPYATVVINGLVCSQDRGNEYDKNKYASAACSRVVAPGDHVVGINGAYTRESGVIVLGL